MAKFFREIWSFAKNIASDTRDDFRKLINGQGSSEDPLKPSPSLDSEEFAPRGTNTTKAHSAPPNNSGGNSKSSSGKVKREGQGTKSTQNADSKSTKLPANGGKRR